MPVAGSNCHNLSYYTSHSDLYFTSNTVLNFLSGSHYLTKWEPVVISDVSNLTLFGIGYNETGRFHLKQSTVNIECVSPFGGGLEFMNCTNISIVDLGISNCGFESPLRLTNSSQYNSSLLIIESYGVLLDRVSISGGKGFGLLTYNSLDLDILSSSFLHNQADMACLSDQRSCPGGNAFLIVDASKQECPDEFEHFYINIFSSSFMFGMSRGFTDSGGGLSISLSEISHYQLHITLDSATANGNIASTGANLFFKAFNTDHYLLELVNIISAYGNFIMDGSYNDSLDYRGGGMHIHVSTSILGDRTHCDFNTSEEQSLSIRILDSHFTYNSALLGGGLSIQWFGSCSGSILVDSCTIQNNRGLRGMGVTIQQDEVFSIPHNPVINFRDTVIDSNNKLLQLNVEANGAIFTANVKNLSFCNVQISNNAATGVFNYQSVISFQGRNNTVVGNRAMKGGGMSFCSGGFLVLRPGTEITFLGNTAQLTGGAIYTAASFMGSHFPPCFYQLDGSQTEQARLVFEGNEAGVAGDVLYGGSIEHCRSNLEFNATFYYPNQVGQSVVASDAQYIAFCRNGTPDFDNLRQSKTGVPGRVVSISVAAVGQNYGLTTGEVSITKYSYTDNALSYWNISTAQCVDIDYPLTAFSAQNQTLLSLHLATNPYFTLIVDITVEPCPSGFTLDNVTGECACSTLVSSAVSAVQCEISTQEFYHPQQAWIGSIENITFICAYNSCPFDYCTSEQGWFTLDQPDLQCVVNRSGVLCGQCASGLSLLLGSNRCKECTNFTLILIIPFALAGVGLVCLLFLLDFTVSEGTILPIIFYANIVKVLEPDFHNGQLPIILSQFISWLNLDLGIETCFYNGLDAYNKVWLQLVFPSYLLVIVLVIIIACHCSTFLTEQLGSRTVPVLSTLILLSYTKLIRILASVFYIANVPCDGLNAAVWYVDGNLDYLGFAHAGMLAFAVLLLMFFIIPYTAVLLLAPLLQRKLVQCKQFRWLWKFKPFFDAHSAPYKENHQSWMGLLLLTRICLVIILPLSSTPLIELTALVTSLVIFMASFWALKGVYKQFHLNILEFTLMLNLLLVSYLAAIGSESDETIGQIVSEYGQLVLIAIVFVTFVVVVFVHIMAEVKKLRKKWKARISSYTPIVEAMECSSNNSRDPNFARAYVDFSRLRESILGADTR